jgi:CpeT protein
MIELFKQYLSGKFSNKIQAFSYPSRYAHINITHIDIGDGLYYGEQAYNYQPGLPYRQFVLEPILSNNKITVLNYEILDKQNYRNGKNLELLTRNQLTKKEGCDTIFEYVNESFIGGTTGCECFVNWRGRETYLQTNVELTKNFYYVIDKGICVKHNHQIWGSKYGRFEFARMPV